LKKIPLRNLPEFMQLKCGERPNGLINR